MTLHLRYFHLLLLVGFNGLILFLIGYFASRLGPFIELILGPILYTVAFSVPTKSVFWRELRPFLVIILGSSSGTGLIWASCRFMQSMVCQHYAFKAQVITNLVFRLIMPVILWPFSRLPELIKNRNNGVRI